MNSRDTEQACPLPARAQGATGAGGQYHSECRQPDGAVRIFRSVFWLTLALKVVLSAAVPLTGDEAYFVLWGRNIDYGYYDHPPMCGWLVHLMLYLGSSPVILRLPAVLFSQFVGIGIYIFLRRRPRMPLSPGQGQSGSAATDTDRPSTSVSGEYAALAATLYLVTPLNVLNVLITTDTGLFLFAFCSVAFFAEAIAGRRLALFALSGVFLGLAFLSKYFAVLLAIAFLIQVAFFDRSRAGWVGLLLTAAASLPFALLHVAWNYNHSWVTFTFNALGRREPFDPWNIPLLAGAVAYLATPAVVWYLARHWRELRRPFSEPAFVTFILAFLVAIVSFGAVSFAKTVGLHWLLSFVPFLFVLLFRWFSTGEFYGTVRLTAFFTVLHLALVAVILALPVDRWRNLSAYQSIVEGAKPDLVRQVLSPYAPHMILATRSYSRSSVLSYHLGTNVIVFGRGSIHGRQFDLATDFSALDGKDMLIVETDEYAIKSLKRYFKRTRVVPVRIAGADYYLVLGHEFNYKRYRERVLGPVVDRYWTPPAWLPHGPCPLREQYFPEERGPEQTDR